jgi:hypothetical protein
VSRSLPIVGGERANEASVEPWPPERRLVPSFPLVAVVGAMPEARAIEQARAFLQAARDAGAAPVFFATRRRAARGPADVLERAPGDPREARPFFDAGASRALLVEAEPSAIAAGLGEALARLEGARIAVSLGAEVLAFVRPRFAVAIDRGASLVGWDPSVRAIRDRFDARLPEPRGGWAEGVVRALLAP